jgi:predicted enzyme related to lactoylglutathione lyase
MALAARGPDGSRLTGFAMWTRRGRRPCHPGATAGIIEVMLKNAPIVPYIPARDVARARKFYEEKVGLVPREEVAGGVVYECGNRSWIFLYPSAGAGTSKASQAFWQVDDAEAEVAELRARGVVFEEYDMPGIKTVNGIATAGGSKAAWFKDSEGNILAVIQTLK